MASLRLRLLRVLALIGAFSVLTAEPVAAMSCPAPDPWFLTTISVPQMPSLPEGVLVRVAPRRLQPTADEPPWNNAVLNWLELENTTARPLYVLEDAEEYQRRMGYEAISRPDVDLGDAASGMQTRLKLQNSTWYGWPTNCAVIKCDRIEWLPGTGNLMIAGGDFGLSRAFQDRVTRNKNRPANVAVPDPQSGVLTLSYGGHALTVPFIVTYELNDSYDPAHGSENCGSGLAVVAGVLLLIVAAGIALPVLVLVRLIRKWSPRAPA